ncbi:HAD family hydrolase [Streptomyces sp. NPDC059753]|uniref:HAD family hydrolase n=1 Tax=Streptomyces sp. NPDC059753 TaxID=3346933 RepID=UPI003646C57B
MNASADRDAAFRAAVAHFLAEHGLPDSDLTWVTTIDASGYSARHEVASALSDRYGDVVPTASVRALLDNGVADHVVLTRSSREALSKAQADGWTCVIVTNGRTVQQEAKILNTGLDQLVQGWVISETVGHKKPEPEIFHAAAAGSSSRLRWSGRGPPAGPSPRHQGHARPAATSSHQGRRSTRRYPTTDQTHRRAAWHRCSARPDFLDETHRGTPRAAG